MAEPRREQALQALVALLEGMTGIRSWGGQYLAKPTVSRRVIDFSSTMEWPYLIVVQASNSRLNRLIDISNDYRDNFRFVVYGYVRGNDVELPSRWIARLQDDVIRTILGGGTLNGIADLIEAQEDRTDEGESYPVAAFAQYFTAYLPEAIFTE